MLPRRPGDSPEVVPAIGLDRTVSQTASGEVEPPVDTLGAGAPQARYRIDAEVGRGGIGRILRARDERLGRDVAVKELLSIDSGHRLRFQREAAITARLEHPAIVPVHDVGEWSNGAPFYVMKLLSSGRTLKEAIVEARDLDGRMALLPNIIAIADAVAYAHSLGIVHRDLKPSNVLLGSFGETLVIDWGLAKELFAPADLRELGESPYRQRATGSELTTVGAIVGTPQYMAPEQARGEQIDMRADVYALGAILYHLLSGRPPYHGRASMDDVVRDLRESGPSSVQELEPAIPQELATIVHKAMARTPSNRYESASRFAEDLKRFQTGQLVGAHEYSRSSLARRWLRRNRRLVTMAAVFVLMLAVTATVSVRRIVRERDIARERSNKLILEQAKSSLVSDPTTALGWLKLYKGSALDRASAIAVDANFRGVARQVLRSGKVNRAIFSPDGKQLASGGYDGVIRLWDVARGQLLRTLSFREVYVMTMSPDGQTLAVAGGEVGDIRVWNVATGRVRDLKHDQATVADLQLLDGGRRLLSLGEDSSLHLWSLDAGGDRRLPMATAIAVAADGRQFATASGDGTITLYNADGVPGATLGRHDGLARYLMWSGKGDTVVSAGDRAIAVWDIAQHRSRVIERIGPLAHSTAELHPSVALSADGTWLAAVTSDRVLHVWNLPGGTHHSMALAGSLPSMVRFASRGGKLAIGDARGLVRLFDLESGSQRELLGHTNCIQWLEFSPTQPLLASASGDATIRLWPTDDQSEHVLGSSQAPVLKATYAPDTRALATSDEDGNLVLWNGPSGAPMRLHGHSAVTRGLDFSSDGAWLASASWDKTVRLWRVADGAARTKIDMPDAAESVLFLPGDRQLVVIAGSEIWLADAQSGKLLRRLGQYTPGSIVTSLRQSPVAPELATAGTDGSIHVIRLDPPGERILRGHSGVVFTAGFSSDGKTLLSSGADGTVRLWNIADGTSRIVRQQRVAMRPALFVLDDRHVATPTEGGTIIIDDLASGASWTLPGHDQNVFSLVASPDRKLLASASMDGTVRLWDLRSGRSGLLGRPGAGANVQAVAFSQDGRRLALGNVEGEVQQYDVGSIAFLPRGRDPSFGQWLDQATNLKVEDRQSNE